MSNVDKKIQIYKMRISSLIDEHADALAQAQEFHHQLQESRSKISELEEQLRNVNVQEDKQAVTIINHPVDTPKH